MPVTLTDINQQTLASVGTNKALPITTYNSKARDLSQKTTYMIEEQFSSTVATGVVFAMQGSDSKLVKIHKITIQGTHSVGIAVFPKLTKTKTATSLAGSVITATILDGNIKDSTAVARVFATSPSGFVRGESVGDVGIFRTLFNLTGATVKSELVEFDFVNDYGNPLILRGTNQGVELTYAGSAGTFELIVTAIFTEEDY